MLPATRNSGPAIACQSASSASASTMVAAGTFWRSAGTRSASFSIATSFPALPASASVSPPGPAPISSTVSPAVGPSASAMRSRMRRSERKCWPSLRLARGTSDPEHQNRPIVLRTGAECLRRGEDRLHDRFGRLVPMVAHVGEEPLLAERLALLVPRVDQPISPEHQEIMAHAPRHLAALNAPLRGEP